MQPPTDSALLTQPRFQSLRHPGVVRVWTDQIGAAVSREGARIAVNHMMNLPEVSKTVPGV